MYLFTDTETGGRNTQMGDLLSAGFLLTDISGKEIDRLVVRCKPERDYYKVTAEALGVNKINLVEHHKIAKSYKECAVEVLKFLNKHGVSKLNTTLIGHRTQFDINFLEAFEVLDNTILRNYLDRTYEDTAIIASFLRIKFANLADLAAKLKVDISDLNAHTEIGDCEITRRCYFKMVDMVYGEVNGQETNS